MARRSKSREVALQMLYQKDFNSDADAYQMRAMIDEQLSDEELAGFCWQIVVGVLEHKADLDRRIAAAAENWSLDRMAPTDRNALRIGAFEILFSDTPPRVAIDEAIELSRKFGSSQSSQFVNGILDQLLKHKPSA
jgi:N utilization substance protein B